MSVSSNECLSIGASPQLWDASRKIRAHTYHGTGVCRQRLHPFHPAMAERPGCAPCSEFHQVHLIAADKRIRKAALDRAGMPIQQLPMWIAKKSALDAIDITDSINGRATNLKDLPNRKWFAACCTDDLDASLMVDLLYFVRSGDEVFDDDVFPISRWAERYGIDRAEVITRVRRVLETMAANRPDWVQANVDGPLSERLAKAGCDDSVLSW